MKRIVIIFSIILCAANLETHSFNINNYSFVTNNWVNLIQDISNHYNQDFWFIKDIFDTSQSYDIDPLLMVALIKIESDFIPTALSKKNAYGYCQITPIANEDVDPTLNRYNHRENIILGTRFIAKLLDRFNGNIIQTLRYYNAGSNYDETRLSYSEDIKEEYDMLTSLYVNKKDVYGDIYKKESF